MQVLQSMEFDDEESNDAVMPIAMPDKPRFPYGLRICLDETILEKLGLDYEEAANGGYFMIRAEVHVTSSSCNTDEDGTKHCRIEGQIEKMAIEGDDVGDTPPPPKSKSIYSKPMA